MIRHLTTAAALAALAACTGEPPRAAAAAPPAPQPVAPKPAAVPAAPPAVAKPAAPPAVSAVPAPAAPAAPSAAPTVAQSGKAIRIDAGADAAGKDAEGNAWLADSGFVGGDTVDRGPIAIANTAFPALYRTEHWGMSGFTWPVPNGKYTVRLHFAETFEDITAAGQRVFSVTVEGQEIKDLDVFKEAGGANKALVKSVAVTVADGNLDITFVSKDQAAEINGIEIVPHP